MRQLIMYGLLACMLISCKKDKAFKLYGTYKGTFQRTIGGNGQISNVTVTFTGNKFSGESSEANYPAICNGSFTLKGRNANFANACMFPANFDWSLILSGEYDMQINGDSLLITRYRGDFVLTMDQYKLVRQQ